MAVEEVVVMMEVESRMEDTIISTRGVAKNFGLGGPNYIFIHTYIYTAIYIYILEIIIFINFNEYKQIVYFAINMYKNVLPLFNCNFFLNLSFLE